MYPSTEITLNPFPVPFSPHWDSSSSSVRGWPNTFTCKVLRLQSNTQSIFLTVLVQGNTSIFICMGADLARGPAIASSLGFVATHIRPGISQRGLWRVWPSPRSLSSSLRLPSTPTSALPLMLARGAAPSIVASQASPDPICSGGTFMWFTPAAWLPAAIHPAPQAPPWSALFRVQGLDRAAAWPELPAGIEEKKQRP